MTFCLPVSADEGGSCSEDSNTLQLLLCHTKASLACSGLKLQHPEVCCKQGSQKLHSSLDSTLGWFSCCARG